MLKHYGLIVGLLCVYALMFGGCKKSPVHPASTAGDSFETSTTAVIEYETTDTVALDDSTTETTTTSSETMDSANATTDTKVAKKVRKRKPMETPLCVKHGWLPLSPGLVGDMLLTAKNEIRLYRPVDPNTSSGINYGEVWISLPDNDITSIPMATRMYRNELVAKLPKEVTPPVTVLFETKRIPEGNETLEYTLEQVEEKRPAGNSREDLRAFALMEQMKTTFESLKESVNANSWKKIEPDVRLLNDQTKRFREFTRNMLNPKQNEAAILLYQNTNFVLDCVANNTHPDMKPLVEKYAKYMEVLKSLDEE